MVTRRCSYTAVHIDALVFLLLLCNLPFVRVIPESGVADHAACALYKSVCDGPKVRVRLILCATYTPENTVSLMCNCNV